MGIESQEAFGTPTVTQVPPMQVAINGEVKIAAELELIPGDVVDAIRAADPELAKEIQIRSPQDAMLLINLFTALMQLVQIVLTVYQILHPQPVTPTQIVEIFNNTTNYVINMPPAHE